MAELCKCGHAESMHNVQIGREFTQILPGCYVCADCVRFSPAPAPPAAAVDWQKEALGYLFDTQPQTNGEIAEAMAEFARGKLARAESELAALREEVEKLRSALALIRISAQTYRASSYADMGPQRFGYIERLAEAALARGAEVKQIGL